MNTWLPSLVSMAMLLIAFWTAHRSNVRRIERDAQWRQEIKVKVDMIYDWFCNNVVGRGEPPRFRGGSEE